MPVPIQPLGYPQAQMRNRIAMQMMRPLGAPGTTAPRPAIMPAQLRSYVDPNQQAMQQQQALQQQQQASLSDIFGPRIR